jgi:two-component system sensor histidine kinase BaeS
MMRIKLSYKLCGAFFLIMAISVGAMFLWRALFFRNFRAYIQQEEVKQLEALVPALQEAYRTQGGWQGVAADPDRWKGELDIGAAFLRRHPPPATDTPREAEPRGLLTDARNQPVIGTPGPDDQPRLVAITVDGATVGWLGLRKREPFKSGPPAALLNLHTQQLYIIGSAVIALTAFIAFLFAQHLLKPIQRLTRGTRELTDRHFEVRIPATTRDELGQLAENFNAMAETLERYEAMRRQWLTDISHELRTPLAVLRGEIEALQDGLRPASADNLASLHAEILRLGKLVEDLHLLSLADSDQLQFRRLRVALRTLLEDILARFETRFARRGITIEADLVDLAEVHLRGDPDRLAQVFANILDNACKYTGSPGVLQIGGRADEARVTLRFADAGPGVPQAALPRLFDRLYRVDPSRSRASGGSGLGLSICRQIVEHHGGRIWAERSSLGGLAVGIELPREGAAN